MSEGPARPAGYPDIGDYGLIGDSHSLALVSRTGSIDWHSPARMDSGSCFGRLLDWEKGGFCSISARVPADSPGERHYVEDTLVLVTELTSAEGSAELTDCMTMSGECDEPRSRHELVRVLEGTRGALEFEIRLVPRFDYGDADPWLRHQGSGIYVALAGDDAVVIASDAEWELTSDRKALHASGVVRPGERVRLAIVACDPTTMETVAAQESLDGPEVDRRLDETVDWWRRWSRRLRTPNGDATGVERSAAVLRALTYGPTGAIAAAGTTSLPEVIGGVRNWDYRFSWVRDSVLAVRSLAELGCEDEAAAFRLFIERSAGGNAKDLQVVFGIAGERRLDDDTLDHLAGYRDSRPVRVGNGASGQLQLDVYGHLLEQSWSWYRRGHEPDDDYWRFLVDLVEAAIEHWQDPDAGIWEWPDRREHFVHSKAMCWAAVDRGLRLAEACMRRAPERRWRAVRDEIHDTVERRGYDSKRGVFVQRFGSQDLDVALLRLPSIGFVDYTDERMIRTVDAVVAELSEDGLLRRHRSDDGLPGQEGVFIPATFWLVEVLAGQGRLQEARQAYDRVFATANDLGLFSEEYDPGEQIALGNFPQALSHLSHLEAAIALDEARSGSEVSVGG
jgi:GH15 family glucan-1,4-alpha-glucosidase